MPDWKKEIKLSDLFKRGSKPAEKWEAEAPEEKPEKTRRRLSKPELPKLSRGPRKEAPALPAVPLMRAFNLMPKEDLRQAEGGRRPSPAQLVLAVVGLVTIAGLASFFLITNAGVADKQREYDDLRAELAAKSVPVQEPGVAGDSALVQERDQRRGALATALGSRVAWDRLLREFSLILPDDVWLKSLKGTSSAPVDPAVAPTQVAAPNAFEINGYTRKQEGVARLLARMAVLPELESVALLSATAVKLGNQDVVEFTIKATVRARAAGGAA
jgi:Tfp pilus assembly protein PilN